MENIRKQIARKRLEQKRKYKKLREQAWEVGWQNSWEIREQENHEWNKFKFLCGLSDALDKKE